jgi:F-box interacting protein
MEAGQFPADMLFDIFSRLPIKSLMRFRCVSPTWRSIIDDPCLAYMHRLRCAEEPKVLILDPPTHEPADATLREDGVFLKASLNLLTRFANSKAYSLRGCCNGLLCLTKQFCGESPLFLFNPPRQEVVELQPPCIAPSRKKYGLGFDCSTNTYKIVGVFDDDLSAQVYTLGGAGSWRAVSEGPPCPLLGRPVYSCGALHWLCGDDEGKIVCFDVGKEEFGLISRPEFRSSHLLDLRGELAIVDRSSDTHVEIWVMKEYGKKEWVKEYKIGVKGVRGNEFVEVVGVCEHGEILLKDVFENYFLYNPGTDMLKYSHIPSLNDETQVLCHMGSLLSIALFGAY